ncbi:MAG: hypothetical protein WCO99_07815 [Planctomycetota bacterium]
MVHQLACHLSFRPRQLALEVGIHRFKRQRLLIGASFPAFLDFGKGAFDREPPDFLFCQPPLRDGLRERLPHILAEEIGAMIEDDAPRYPPIAVVLELAGDFDPTWPG